MATTLHNVKYNNLCIPSILISIKELCQKIPIKLLGPLSDICNSDFLKTSKYESLTFTIHNMKFNVIFI